MASSAAQPAPHASVPVSPRGGNTSDHGMVIIEAAGSMSEPRCAYPESFLEASPDVDMVTEEAQAATEEIHGPAKMEPERGNLEARAIAETVLSSQGASTPSATVDPPPGVHALGDETTQGDPRGWQR